MEITVWLLSCIVWLSIAYSIDLKTENIRLKHEVEYLRKYYRIKK